jgi:hypothetical protein
VSSYHGSLVEHLCGCIYASAGIVGKADVTSKTRLEGSPARHYRRSSQAGKASGGRSRRRFRSGTASGFGLQRAIQTYAGMQHLDLGRLKRDGHAGDLHIFRALSIRDGSAA